jgi:hypothetical protein
MNPHRTPTPAPTDTGRAGPRRRARTRSEAAARLRRGLAFAAIAVATIGLPARPAAADQWAPDASAQVRVTGTYRPLVGNFAGDERDDLYWYAPGSGAESLWIGTGIGTQPFIKQPAPSVNGTFTPLVGNFSGDAYEEILWYAPGTGQDWLWNNPAGEFEPEPISVNGTFTPLVLENPGTWSAIFWYAPGTAPDSLWQFNNTSWTSSSHPVSSTFRPFTVQWNDDLLEDIFWYAPGTAADYLWLRSPSGGFTSSSRPVNGTFTPLVGEFSQQPDNREEILWSNSSGLDALWTTSEGGLVTSIPVNLPNRKGVVAEAPGSEQVLLYGGSGPDQVWRREADATITLETQTTFDAPDPSVVLPGFFANTSSGSIFFYRAGALGELFLR